MVIVRTRSTRVKWTLCHLLSFNFKFVVCAFNSPKKQKWTKIGCIVACEEREKKAHSGSEKYEASIVIEMRVLRSGKLLR